MKAHSVLDGSVVGSGNSHNVPRPDWQFEILMEAYPCAPAGLPRCVNFERCATERLACHAFSQYANPQTTSFTKWESAPRKPDAAIYAQVFRESDGSAHKNQKRGKPDVALLLQRMRALAGPYHSSKILAAALGVEYPKLVSLSHRNAAIQVERERLVDASVERMRAIRSRLIERFRGAVVACFVKPTRPHDRHVFGCTKCGAAFSRRLHYVLVSNAARPHCR